MRRQSICLLLSLCLLAMSMILVKPACARIPMKNPAVKILRAYGMQVGNNTVVNPYIVSLLSIHAMKKGRLQTEVKGFIQWYFTHLNYPDKYGLTGTIYDYSISEKHETHDRNYDSIDGYAGIFLILLDVYHEKTGDTELIRKYRKQIQDIAYIISVLQEGDGLTKVAPDNSTKYLMNNCEAYGGIRAYNRLNRLLGNEDKYYLQVEQGLKSAIVKLFFDETGQNYYWAIAGSTRHKSSWGTPYPDAFAQIFPLLHGLVDGKSGTGLVVWNRFMALYGKKIPTFPIEQQIVIQLTKDSL